MAAPTKEELEIIPKFRKNLEDLDLQGFLNTDMGLLQWLRARELNLTKAGEMLRNSIKWRRDNQIASLETWTPTKELVDLCPYEFAGVDKENCPIMYSKYGRWNLRQIYNLGYREEYLKYVSQMFEKATKRMENRMTPSGQPVTQFLIICDMQDLSYRTLASIGAMNMTLAGAQSFDLNYPETMKKTIVINASRLFAAFFAFFKPILSARTCDKVEIYDTRQEIWKKRLLELVDKDQLPKEMLGNWDSSDIIHSSGTSIDEEDEEEIEHF